MTGSELIFYAGLMLVGITVLIAAVAIPVLILTGRGLRKQLDSEYGIKRRKFK